MNTANIWTEKDRCNGLPCLRNTRFTIAQLIAEIAEHGSVEGVANSFNLDPDCIREALEDVSVFFNQKIIWHEKLKSFDE